MEPIKITGTQKYRLHEGNKFLRIARNPETGKKQAFCMKFSTNKKKGYENTIGGGRIRAAFHKWDTKACREERRLVLEGTPIHVLTFDGSPQTWYHGRYRCIEPNHETHFILEFVDKGLFDKVEKETETTRKSKLEEDAETFFENRGWNSVYEPCNFPYGCSKNYTPDYFLPEFSCFVEIKGFRSPDGKQAEPTKKTLEKCHAVSSKGMPIVLVQGSLLGAPVFTFWEPFGKSEKKQPWFWKKRKR